MEHFTLPEILTAFGFGQDILIQNKNFPAMNFLGVNLYQPDTELFRQCLYIAEGDQIPPPLLSGYYGCILASPSPDAVCGPYASETVIWPEKVSATVLLNRIQNLFLSQTSQAHMAHMLMSSLSLCSSIKSIILQAAAIMQNAIILLDPAYQLIAMEGLGCDVNDIFWQDCLLNGRLSDENVLLIKNTGMMKDLEQASSVTLWQNANHFNDIPRLAQKIYSQNGAYLGTIAVLQCLHAFSSDDYFLLDALVETLSHILEHYETLTDCQKLDSALLKSLMEASDTQLPQSLAERKAELEKNNFFQAGFISLSNDPSLARLGQYLQASLLAEQTHILSTLGQKQVILLFCYENVKESHNMYSWLHKKLTPLGADIGLSYIFSSLDDFHRQVKLAMNAFSIGVNHATDSCLHIYSHLTLLPLFDTLSKPTLEKYVKDSPPAILWRGHHTELYRTLQCFVWHQGSYVDTARETFIHKNTLLYRLSKIQTLTGIDYGSPEDLLAAAYAFQVLEYLHASKF